MRADKVLRLCSLLLLTLASCKGDGGGNGDGGGGTGTPSNATSQLQAVTAARSIRLYIAFGNTVINTFTPENANIRFDGNLYYKASLAGLVTTVTFYTDAAGTQAAGTIVTTSSKDLTSPSTTYPITLSGNANITAGLRPLTGTFTVSFSDKTTLTQTGSVQVTAGGGASGNLGVDFDLDGDAVTDRITGTATATTAGATVSMSNILMDTSKNPTKITGAMNVSPANVGTTITSMTIDRDTSAGTLALSDGTQATWDMSGAGTVTLPDATVVTIASFDKGS